MADLATLQVRLTEAEDALHRLSTGAQEVSVNTGAKSVSYSPVSMGKLQAYIADLKSKMADAGDTTMKRRRAVAVGF